MSGLVDRLRTGTHEQAVGVNQMCDCPLHTLFPMRTSELVEPTLLDLQAACALIGKDTYGKPHWTPETISHCNPVVQAFAKHARAAIMETRNG